MLFFFKLIFRNIFRQKLRSLLTALGITLAVVAFCLLSTMVNSWYAGVDAASAKRLICRNAISLGFSLPLSYLHKIRKVEGVEAVSYGNWFGGVYINEKNFFPQFAIDPTTYFKVLPQILLPEEEKLAFMRDRHGAVAGIKLVQQYGWKIGDVIPLRGTIYPGHWSFVLRGIYRGAEKGFDESTFFIHWQNLNENLKKNFDDRADQVGIFFIEVKHPEKAAEISRAVDEQFKNSLAETMTETEKAFQLSFVVMIETIVVAIQVVSFVVIAIIMAVMANTMAMNVRDRTREYATMRALGFKGGYIVSMILGEATLLSMSSGLLGIFITLPLVKILGEKLATLFPVFMISQQTLLLALSAAFLIGFVAAVFPLWGVLTRKVGDGLRDA